MLFFTIEDKGKYIYLKRKKFTFQLSLIPAICYFILFPIVYLFVQSNAIAIGAGLLFFVVFFFGIWLAVEGCITSYTVNKYRKKGNKIEFETGKEVGISAVKIYKK
jgi:hypothetical protein